MKRLLKYLKPHKISMGMITILVLFIVILELYKPIIIGDAIDEYINGYYYPYIEVEASTKDTMVYQDVFLRKVSSKEWNEIEDTEPEFYQMILYQERYYLVSDLTKEQCLLLERASDAVIETYVQELQPLEREELKSLRQSDLKGIWIAAVIYLLVLVLNFLCNALETLKLQKVGQEIVFEMREQLFAHIHSLSLNYFNTTPVGKLVTRVSNDTEAVNEMFSSILVKLFKNSIKIIGYGVVMVSINVRMALYSFAILPVVAALTFFFRHLSRKASRITRNKITEINTFLSEHLAGMKLIQIFAREEAKYDEFEKKSYEFFKAGFREVMIFAIFRPMIYFLSVVALILVLGNGSILVLSNQISIGVLFIFINYISSFFDPIQELAEQFGTLQQSLASAEKVFQILDEKPDILSPLHPVPVKIRGRIEFRHVWFAYEEEDYILKDVSFTIEPGEKIAFVGATGAGKSSILNLIGRYFDIQRGEILIDGVNIQNIDINVLRRAIGQVQQDVFIFTGDIKSNINLLNKDLTIEDAKRAARVVHADEFIEKLPHGYDEPVTERGATLSAGQRQLLSFARTLAYQPTILVLDEATANIDTETESLITSALERLMEGRTTIMVAHRLSTIQHADKIMVMDHGQIIESGNHNELLLQDGIYSRLYELQLSNHL